MTRPRLRSRAPRTTRRWRRVGARSRARAGAGVAVSHWDEARPAEAAEAYSD